MTPRRSPERLELPRSERRDVERAQHIAERRVALGWDALADLP